MKNIIILILLSTSSSIFAEEVDLQEVLDNHYDRIETYEETPLGPGEEILYSLLKKLAKHRLTPKMLHYFTKHPFDLETFYRVSKYAESASKSLCQVSSEKRHESDEVDAIRHFIWAGYMAKNLGTNKALLLQSLQEDRRYNDFLSMKMDLYNNQVAINYVSKNSTELFAINRRGRSQFDKKIKEAALEFLKAGKLKVTESKKSYCQRDDLYPNLF